MSLITWQSLIPVVEGHTKEECTATVEEHFYHRRVLLEDGYDTDFKIHKKHLFTITLKGAYSAVQWFNAKGLNLDTIPSEFGKMKYRLFTKFVERKRAIRDSDVRDTGANVQDIGDGTVKTYRKTLPKTKSSKPNI